MDSLNLRDFMQSMSSSIIYRFPALYKVCYQSSKYFEKIQVYTKIRVIFLLYMEI
jgi:hypothetical protein